MIVFNAVSKAFGGWSAVRGLSLEIGRRERVALLGPSGCGKTTVLRLLAGFVAPDEGAITVNGVPVSSARRVLVPPERRNIGMVFQDLALWPHLSVRENLLFGLRARKTPEREREGRVADYLRRVRLEGFADRRPAELSGGQQQRVALARALVLKPDVLLMDEPLSGLDPELNQAIRKEILLLQETLGFTLLYVTHNREEAFDLGERIVYMRDGVIEGVMNSAVVASG